MKEQRTRVRCSWRIPGLGKDLAPRRRGALTVPGVWQTRRSEHCPSQRLLGELGLPPRVCAVSA